LYQLTEETAMTITCDDQLTPPENNVTGQVKTEEISLYYAIGGRRSLVAAVQGFYGRLFADPEIAPFFPHGVTAQHKAYLVTVLGEALGGPERYRGPDLAKAHAHLSITDHHFSLVAGHLDGTLEDLSVPRDLIDQIIGIVATLRTTVVTAE
jgi:hemoglobin